MYSVSEISSDELKPLEKYCIKDACRNPSVSVIVPAYNSEKFIKRCLISLIKQTLKEIEIIVVNDGSADNTLSVVETFAKADGRIKIIDQKNAKQGAARNRGTEIACGEYIGYVDSDDWVDLEYYEKLYNATKKYDADIALATNVRIGNGKTKKRLNIDKEVYVTDLQDKIDISHQVTNPCPTNKIYRRAMLLNNPVVWPEGVYCEDKLFTIKALYYSKGLVTVPGVYYYYYRNPNSTVNSKAKQLVQDKNNAKVSVLRFLKEKDAQVRDGDFWAPVAEKRIFGITWYRHDESLHSERISILGWKFKKTSL